MRNTSHSRRGQGRSHKETSMIKRQFQNEPGCHYSYVRLQGLWVVQAPGEAEATCAALNQGGYVDACATVDSDVLLFGAETAFHTLRPLVTPPAHSSQHVTMFMVMRTPV